MGRKCVAEDVAWPEPIKYLDFQDREVQVRCLERVPNEAYISAAKPVKGFVFDEREGVRLSDNGFDIMPGPERTVHVQGCKAKELTWRYVGMEKEEQPNVVPYNPAYW